MNVQSNSRPRSMQDNLDRSGGPRHPWVCEPPPNLDELRRLFKKTLAGDDVLAAAAPDDSDLSGLDSMIAEMTKMAVLGRIFGEEGKAWECGERAYLPGSIQTQVIVFKDGRPPLTFYSDFSKFGAF